MRKLVLLTLFAVATSPMVAQNNINTKRGFAAEGYDVVAYFQGEARKGDADFVFEYEGVKYKFSSNENLNTFNKNPQAYIPQYGGFCAYAIAKDAKKVGVDPKTFLITDGKLYLFYNSWGVNTLQKWKDENPTKLLTKADKNWSAIIESN